MRVLLVANTLPPADVSGVGEQVLQLAAGLRELGHQVEVMGRGPGGARGPKVWFPLTAVPAVLSRLRAFRPEVVQVHESDGALVALAVRLFGRFFGRPRLTALLQVSYVEERRAVRDLVDETGRVLGRPSQVERRFRWVKAPLQITLGRWTARLAARVFVPSEATGREVARDYLAGREVIPRVVPNVTGGLTGVLDVPTGEPGGEEPGYLLFVGRLRLRKGVEVLLEAAALAPGARVLIAGEGEHLAALEARHRELGLENQVLFLGRCSAGRVRTLLAGARALVVPSIYEGMPLVVLEAMDAGVPVIASAVSGIPEVVIDGETGWLVPAERPRTLAAAITAALDDPAEASRRGAAGQARVAAMYRPVHAARQWLAGLAGSAGSDG